VASNLLFGVRSTTGGTCPASWATVPDLTSGNLTVAGTNSVVLVIAQVQIAAAADTNAEFRFLINGSAVGSPVLKEFADAAVGEVGSMTLVHAVTGLSGAANTFICEWQIPTGGTAATIDTARHHTLQVLEITAGDATIDVNASSTAEVSATASFTNLFQSTGISIAGTSSVIIMLANVALDSAAAGPNAEFQFGVDNAGQGAVTCGDSDRSVGPEDCNDWSGIHVLTGLSAATHSFELKWRNAVGTMTTDAGRLSTFQVIEVTTRAVLKVSYISATGVDPLPTTYADINRYTLTGITRDKDLAVQASARCVLLKHDNATEASRIYSLLAHANSDGSGVYTFTGPPFPPDSLAQYAVMSINQAPITRGVTNDNLQPTISETMSASYTIAATTAIAFVVANAQVLNDTGNDEAADMRIAIDDAAEGATLTSWTDATSRNTRNCLAWCETGLSAASHKFAVQAQIVVLTPGIDDLNRSLFVVEFTQ